MINFIKMVFRYYDSTYVRWLLYISIAFLISVYNSLSEYVDFAAIPPLKLVLIFMFGVLQGLIAWRAFIDQSISREDLNSQLPPLSGK